MVGFSIMSTRMRMRLPSSLKARPSATFMGAISPMSAPGDECPACAGDDDNIDLIVPFHVVQGDLQVRENGLVQGVERPRGGSW